METVPENCDTSFSNWSSSDSSGGTPNDDASMSSNVHDGDVAAANDEANLSSDAIRKNTENNEIKVNPSQGSDITTNPIVISPKPSFFTSQTSPKVDEIDASNSSHSSNTVKSSSWLQDADQELKKPLVPEAHPPTNVSAPAKTTNSNSTLNKRCSSGKCDGTTFQNYELHCKCLELILPLPSPSNEFKCNYVENSEFIHSKNLSIIPSEQEPSTTSNRSTINDFFPNKRRKSGDHSHSTTKIIYHEHDCSRSRDTSSPDFGPSHNSSNPQFGLPSGYGSKILPDGTSVLVNYEKLLQNEAVKRILLQRSVQIYERTVGDLVRQCDDSRILLQGFEERRKKDFIEIESLRCSVQKLQRDYHELLMKSQSSLFANEEEQSNENAKQNSESRGNTPSSLVPCSKQPHMQLTTPILTTKIIAKVKKSQNIFSLKLLLVVCIMWLAVMNVSVHTSVVKKMVEHQEIENVARRKAFLRGRGLDAQAVSVADNHSDGLKDTNSDYIAAEDIAREPGRFGDEGEHHNNKRNQEQLNYDGSKINAIKGIDIDRNIGYSEMETKNATKGDVMGKIIKIDHGSLDNFTIFQKEAVTKQKSASNLNLQLQEKHATDSRNIDVDHSQIRKLANSSNKTEADFGTERLPSSHGAELDPNVATSERNMTSQAAQPQNYSKIANITVEHSKSHNIENIVPSMVKLSLATNKEPILNV